MPVEGWRRNLIAIFVHQAMICVAWTFIFPFIPLYVKTMGVQGDAAAAQWAGVIGAAGAVSAVISQPILGHLSDRHGRKSLLVSLTIVLTITTALMGLVPSPEQLLVLRLIQGASGGTFAIGMAMVVAGIPNRQLGFALGTLQVGVLVGASLGPFVGGYVADGWGFRQAFYVAAALMALGTIAVVLLAHDNFTRPVVEEHTSSFWTQSRALLTITLFPMLTVVIFLTQFGGSIVSPILALFVSGLAGGENAATASGIVLAAGSLVGAVSALVIGRLTNRVGPTVILLVCLLGTALTHFPQAFVDQVWQLLLWRMLLGIFIGGLMPAANALVAQAVPPERRGAAFGVTAAASSAAMGVGPICGALIATYLNQPAVFLATGVLFALTYVWAFIGFRRHRIATVEP